MAGESFVPCRAPADILTIPNNGSMCEWYESENAAFIEDTEVCFSISTLYCASCQNCSSWGSPIHCRLASRLLALLDQIQVPGKIMA